MPTSRLNRVYRVKSALTYFGITFTAGDLFQVVGYHPSANTYRCRLVTSKGVLRCYFSCDVADFTVLPAEIIFLSGAGQLPTFPSVSMTSSPIQADFAFGIDLREPSTRTVKDDEPKNNDGRTLCYWCGGKTEDRPLYRFHYQYCPRCGK